MHTSPLSRLSPDLLSYIIYLSSAEDGYSSPYTRRMTAVSASQVNHQWRSQSLQYPLIWLGPVLDWSSKTPMLVEVLKRSSPLPLDVVIPLDASIRYPNNISEVLEHLNRIRRLELTLMVDKWSDIVQSNQLRAHAPVLEIFSVKVRTAGFGGKPRCAYRPKAANMFGGHAPRLRQFRIHNCAIHPTEFVSASLRVLVIEDLIPLPEFLDALRQMKYLESLRVVRPSHPHGRAFVHDSLHIPQLYNREVHMLNLSELVVSAPLSACSTLLNSLVLPDECTIIVDALFQQGADGLDKLLSYFANMLANWTCEPLTGRQSLRFGMDEVGFSIEGPPDTSTSKHPLLSLTLWWHDVASQVAMLYNFLPLLTSLFGRCRQPPFSLSIVTTTAIHPDLHSDLKTLLIPWLKSLTYLQAIEFRNHETFAIMEKLLRGPRVNVLLPDLGDVTLVEVDFTSQRRRYWRRLLKILKFRASRAVDAPILQLDFVRCVGEFRRENLLGRFGTVVKINGLEFSDDEDIDEASDYTVQELSD